MDTPHISLLGHIRFLVVMLFNMSFATMYRLVFVCNVGMCSCP